MKRDTRTAYRARAAATERSVDEALAEVTATQKAESARLAAEYAERHKPVPYTPEQLKAARYVRTELGWEQVVKVNAKTVTVTTPYSWTERVAIDKILEVLA